MHEIYAQDKEHRLEKCLDLETLAAYVSTNMHSS